MSSPLLFVRDGRTLPFVPVTAAALEAIAAHTPSRRRAYARSLYMAVLELANEARADRVPVSRKTLGERSGCSRELVSDLRPMLEAAGVVVVHERTHAGATLEHEWVAVEPDPQPPEERAPVPARHDPPVPVGHDPRASEARLSQEDVEGRGETESAGAREPKPDPRTQLPEGFPEQLRPHAIAVYRILRAIAEQHPTAGPVWPLSVGKAIAAHPRHPLVAVAHELDGWAVDPPRPIRDVVGTYRTFLSKRRELAATEALAEDGTPTNARQGPPAGVTPIRGVAPGRRGSPEDLEAAERLRAMRLRAEGQA
jgi:hypothetical protein